MFTAARAGDELMAPTGQARPLRRWERVFHTAGARDFPPRLSHLLKAKGMHFPGAQS